MIIVQHEQKLSAYNFACGCVAECLLKQEPEHNPTSIRLFGEHGTYHVRAHDHELHGRICWDVFTTLGAAKKRFAEVKRNIKEGMKRKTFNMA